MLEDISYDKATLKSEGKFGIHFTSPFEFRSADLSTTKD